MSTTWIIIAVVIVILLYIIAVFNSLVGKRNRVKNAWSDIDVQLKRRYDLVPNLVETVKGYKGYEASVLENVTKARTSAMNTQSSGVAGRAQAENMLSGALKSLFAVAENYPQLKASENFQKLQDQLSSLENDIQSARRYYNAAVRELNNAVQVFPASIIAGTFGFKQNDFFGADESEKGAVKVSF
ncbi:MAG: LemA family protein [bacterium]